MSPWSLRVRDLGTSGLEAQVFIMTSRGELGLPYKSASAAAWALGRVGGGGVSEEPKQKVLRL